MFEKMKAKPNEFSHSQSEELMEATKALIDQLRNVSMLSVEEGFEKLQSNGFPDERDAVAAVKDKISG